MRWSRTKGQSGVTLLELLVVIVVLAALSGVAVFSVGALRGGADSAACAADARVLRTAQQSYRAQHQTYVDEDALVAAGLLDAPSANHDVTVEGDAYQVVPTGDCLELSGAELADGATTTAAPTPEELKAAEEAAAKEAAAKEAEAAKAAEEQAAADKAAEEKAAEEKRAAEKAAEEKAAADKAAAEKAEEESGAGCAKGQIDINSADKKALRTIDHIGGDEAERIVKQRPFKSLEELVTVKGLSEGDVKDIINDGEACVA